MEMNWTVHIWGIYDTIKLVTTDVVNFKCPNDILTFDSYPITSLQERKSMGHFSLHWWPHVSEMPGVIMGALSFRQRNPHRFLIRACQVSIKEVPSPPRVSIEIGLTNKNSLAALFTQSGMLLDCIFLLSISHAVCVFKPWMWLDLFLTDLHVKTLSPLF